jgi:hypothetical protein
MRRHPGRAPKANGLLMATWRCRRRIPGSDKNCGVNVAARETGPHHMDGMIGLSRPSECDAGRPKLVTLIAVIIEAS